MYSTIQVFDIYEFPSEKENYVYYPNDKLQILYQNE